MNLAEYASYDALGLAELVRTKQVTPAELAATALSAIAKINPAINAVIGSIPDWEARFAAQPTNGPFYGVPFLVKDLVLHVQGVPCDMGSRFIKGNFVSPHDTDMAHRFKAAGLMMLGRTNTPELGFNATTEPLAFGPCRNPWNLSRSTGGSSGGSAAAVAAGIVPIAHGNDGGGSLRVPAANCGLVGLKPTRGRTPIGPEFGEALHGLGIEGALSRTVRDTAAILDAVQGPGVGDRFVIPGPARPYLAEARTPPRRLEMAFSLKGMKDAKVSQDCVEAVAVAAKLCQSLGHHVEEATPVFDEDQFHTANLIYWCGFLAGGIAGAAEMLGLVPSPDTLEAITWAAFQHGSKLGLLDLEMADALTNMVCRSVARFYTEYDVLITPVLSDPPLPLGFLDQNDQTRGIKEWYDFVFHHVPFTALSNMTGQPAISLPLHRTSDGLPVGVQFVAPYGDEATLVQLAGQLEQAAPWAGRIPPVHVSN